MQRWEISDINKLKRQQADITQKLHNSFKESQYIQTLKFQPYMTIKKSLFIELITNCLHDYRHTFGYSLKIMVIDRNSSTNKYIILPQFLLKTHFL